MVGRFIIVGLWKNHGDWIGNYHGKISQQYDGDNSWNSYSYGPKHPLSVSEFSQAMEDCRKIHRLNPGIGCSTNMEIWLILAVNIGGKSIVTSINNSKYQLFTSVYWKVTGRFIGLFLFFFRELMEVILAK